MPNWCNNHISIFGDKDQLIAFVLAAKSEGSDLSFANLFPCPQPLLDAPAGSDEIYYTIAYGNIADLAGYTWIPNEIKGDRDALMSFVTRRQKYPTEKGQQIADLIKHNLETYGAKNWYDWSIANWGTKWDIEGNGGRDNEDHASYIFDSAWGPPVEAFVQISKSFPGLTFDLEYFESGMGFCGRAEIIGGEIVNNLYDQFSTKEDVQEIIDSDCYGFVNGELEMFLDVLEDVENEES